jgi:hypothetical protein
MCIVIHVEQPTRDRGEMKYEIGQYVKAHKDYESSDQCFVCGKLLKEENVEVKIALTENGTLSTFEHISSQWYKTDWSPRIGKTCLNKFPKGSLFEMINI